MQNIVLSFNLLTLSLIFSIVFPIHYLLLSKQIFYWFDPLLVFVFFNSVSISLVYYLFFFLHSIKPEYFISFNLCTFGFILGVNWGGKKGLPVKMIEKSDLLPIDKIKRYSLLVDIFMVFCLFIMVFSNLLMLVLKGTLPIFSPNPSEAKIILYTGGWGFVKRINLSLANYLFAIPLIKIFHPNIKIKFRQKLFYAGCILTCVLVLVSMGSKSSLLAILNVLFAIILINRVSGKLFITSVKALINKVVILKWTKYIFAFTLIFVLLIVSLSGVETSLYDSVLTRLVSAGDVYYFFYVYDIASYFHHTALDYIPHFFNPLLGMFRLSDYEFPLGVYVLHYAINMPMDAFAIFGPNGQYPIEGLVYFGKYGAPFYSFFVGYFISFIRIGLLKKIRFYPNYFFLVVYVILCSLVVTMATDVQLFIQILFDLIIFGTIILAISAGLLPVFKK